MAIASNARFARAPEIIATDVDGELVLMSIEDGKYYGLDPIGSEVWRRLEEPKSAEALCGELKEHFEGDPEVIERETREFLDKLLENRLLQSA